MSTTVQHAVHSSRSMSDPTLCPSPHSHDSRRPGVGGTPRGRRSLIERVRTIIDRTLDAAFGRFEL